MPKPPDDKRRIAAITAPRNTRAPGSPEWCYQTMNLLRDSYRDIRLDSGRFEECLAELREYRAREKVPIEKPYGTEDRMLQAEIGKRKAEVEAQLRTLKLQAAEAQGKLGDQNGGAPLGNKNAQGGGDNRSIATVVKEERGLTYTYRRLLRDRPDLAEQVKDGKISANAAAIEAGFRKKPTPFRQAVKSVPKLKDSEPFELVVALLPKLSPTEKRKLRDLLV